MIVVDGEEYKVVEDEWFGSKDDSFSQVTFDRGFLCSSDIAIGGIS